MLHRSARTDEVNTANCHAFINSSLAPVIHFRRRLYSVGEVLKGNRENGCTTARWQAFVLRWAAVCRQGPTGLLWSLGRIGCPQISMGFGRGSWAKIGAPGLTGGSGLI